MYKVYETKDEHYIRLIYETTNLQIALQYYDKLTKGFIIKVNAETIYNK